MKANNPKTRPSVMFKSKANNVISTKNRKVINKVLVKCQTKSQPNIKTYFKSKETIIDGNRDSEIKRTSVNSGTVMTTTSTHQKLQNFSSIGSFGNRKNRKNSKIKLNGSKIIDIEAIPQNKRRQTSVSPESDKMNLESVRKSKIFNNNQ